MSALQRVLLWGPEDPYRGDEIDRLGLDGQPSGLHTRVRQILSSHPTAGIYEVVDNSSRVLYIIRSGPARWLEVEID